MSKVRSFIFVISFFGLALLLSLFSKLLYMLSVNNISDLSYLFEYFILVLFISTVIAFLDYIIYSLILDLFEGFVLFIISYLLLFEFHYSSLYILLLGHFGMQDFYLFIGLTILNFLILFKRIHSNNIDTNQFIYSNNTHIDLHWDQEDQEEEAKRKDNAAQIAFAEERLHRARQEQQIKKNEKEMIGWEYKWK